MAARAIFRCFATGVAGSEIIAGSNTMLDKCINNSNNFGRMGGLHDKSRDDAAPAALAVAERCSQHKIACERSEKFVSHSDAGACCASVEFERVPLQTTAGGSRANS